MKRKFYLILILLAVILAIFSPRFFTYNHKVTIAAAANLRYVLEEIKNQYKKEYPKAEIQITYGSSGTLTQQILNGAPFTLFMSADTKFPQKIAKQGFAASSIKTYAYGKVAMWSSSQEVSKGLHLVLSPEVKKIAIANPDNAPYGSNTVKALTSQQLYNKITKKIVWGENINQTAQFAFSGNAEIGFIALSLALSPEMKNKGRYYVLPREICPWVEQAAVLIKGSQDDEETLRFFKYINSPACNSIWEKYGYGLPSEINIK